MTNEVIAELFHRAGGSIRTVNGATWHYTDEGFDMEKFAELIVRMCADYADMAQDAGCEYAGDYVAEAMGYGEDEGITTWRNKV